MTLPHQQRVLDELAELQDKIDRLDVFTGTSMFDGLDADEQTRLHRQLHVMEQYSQILRERINAF